MCTFAFAYLENIATFCIHPSDKRSFSTPTTTDRRYPCIFYSLYGCHTEYYAVYSPSRHHYTVCPKHRIRCFALCVSSRRQDQDAAYKRLLALYHLQAARMGQRCSDLGKARLSPYPGAEYGVEARRQEKKNRWVKTAHNNGHAGWNPGSGPRKRAMIPVQVQRRRLSEVSRSTWSWQPGHRNDGKS